MHHPPILTELAAALALAVIMALAASRVGLPSVVGLLLAGAVAGPYGLGLVRDLGVISQIAEIGVVLLLFTIGLEFPLSRFRRIGRLLFVGGSMQIGLTVAVIAGILMLAGEGLGRSLFFGFVAAVSSTAVVLRGLNERGEMDAPHGRFIMGVLIFQDLMVIPMILLMPLLAGQGGEDWPAALAIALGKASMVVALALGLSRWIVPRLFKQVDALRSREVFLLAVLALCLVTAWMTAEAGLSLALGAFLAGMVLAESDFAHRALGDIMPLRDAFISLFFVSMGLLFDWRVFVEDPVQALAVFLVLFAVKGFIATLACMAMGFPARVAWLAGVGLAQLGEFGLVLIGIGAPMGLVTPEENRIWLASGVLTLLVTPLAMRLAPHFAPGARLLQPLERLMGARGMDEPAPEHQQMSGHVVIVGYGLAGRLLAKSLKAAATPCLIIELNAETVRAAREAGEPAYYGDITSEEALRHAGVPSAAAVVLLINDREAARRAVVAIRHCAPSTPIFLRTRYLGEREAVAALGADEVVSEEAEAGIEMIARVLRHGGRPRNEIDTLLRAARESVGPSARTHTVPRRQLAHIGELEALKVENFRLDPGTPAIGKSLADLQLRSQTGATVVAIRREGKTIDQPDPLMPLETDDMLYLLGNGDALRRAETALMGGAGRPSD